MGTRLHSFRDGMEELIFALMREVGDRVETSAPVVRVAPCGAGWSVQRDGGGTEEAEAVVVSMPAARTARLVADVAPVTAAGLREIPYAPVAVIAILWEASRVGHPLDGYGFLAAGGRFPVLGCLFESTVFPGRAPDGQVLLRTLVGGARNPEAVEGSTDAIAERAVETLRPLLSLEGDPTWVRSVVWPGAIPQYDVRHPARLQAIADELAERPGLHLGGAALRGVSVNHLVADAKRVAAELGPG
jgi:oxygen-dependent protoporphyrinogen oxidase